jgi:hypothetical protein
MPGELLQKLTMDVTPNMSKRPLPNLDLYLVVSSILSSQVLAGSNDVYSLEKIPSTSRTSFVIPVV